MICAPKSESEHMSCRGPSDSPLALRKKTVPPAAQTGSAVFDKLAGRRTRCSTVRESEGRHTAF